MQSAHRPMFGLVATLVVAAGCGGSEAIDASAKDAAAATSTALKRGGTTPTGAYLTVTPNPVDRNAPVTISFYPGSYMDQSLFIKFVCYQNGTMDDVDGSYELHAATTQGFTGYTFAGDHFSWTFVLSEGMNYALQAGPANCDVAGWYENKRLKWYQVASGTFSVQ